MNNPNPHVITAVNSAKVIRPDVPTFLDDEGSSSDIPHFKLKATARELFGVRDDETLAEAILRRKLESL